MSGTETPISPRETINLPSSSFTASRFLYGSIEEISAVSEVVLLGGVPLLWFREQKIRLFRTWDRKTYTDVEKDLKEFNSQAKRLGLKDISTDSRTRKVMNLFRRFPEGYDNDDDEDDDDDNDDDDDDDDVEGDGIDHGVNHDYNNEYDIDDEDDMPLGHPLNLNGIARSDTHTVIEEMDLLLPEAERHFDADGTGNDGIDDSKLDTTATLNDDDNDSLIVPYTPSLPNEVLASATSHENAHPTIREQDPTDSIQQSALSLLSIPQSTQASTATTTNQSFYTAHGSATSLASKQSTSSTLKGPNSQQIVDTTPHAQETVLDPIPLNKSPSELSFVSGIDNNGHIIPTVESELPAATDQTRGPTPRVRFNEATHVSNSRSRSSHIHQLRPSPAVDIQLEKLDRKHDQTLEKMKTVASMTKRRLKKDVKHIQQKRLSKRFIKHFRRGEVIKSEKMLVLVKTPARGSNVSGFTKFTDTEPCDTRVLERWKEYIVVVRSTGDVENPILLQFYTNREIPDTDDPNHSKDLLDIILTKDCHVAFYNTLDRTISLVKDDKIFILRCQTPTSSIRWFTFLNEVLGVHSPTTINVEIPRLRMSISLNLSRSFYDSILDFKFEQVTLVERDHGYHTMKQPIVEEITNKVRNKLIEAGYGYVIDDFDKEDKIMGVCWRYYDRLEWLFGETLGNLFFQQSMHFTHELEFRYVKHYPRVTRLEDASVMVEPPPVEGFLVRLSTREGNMKRGLAQRQVISFDYFSTCDNLVFFGKAHKCIPPLPFDEEIFDQTHLSKEAFDRITSSLPMIHRNNPFEMDEEGHLSWLSADMDPSQLHKRDVYAVYEFERRLNMMKGSDVLNLLDADEICTVDATDIPLNVEFSSGLIWGEKVNLRDLSQLDRNTYFAIGMKNGTRMVLKARDVNMRDEWVRRLNELKKYWQSRLSEDNELIRSIRGDNTDRLNMDDCHEADVFETSPRWETTKGQAQPDIFNITPYSMFRPLIRSGFLFQKPKKHSIFVKYFVVSVPGYVVLYKIVSRKFGGGVTPSTHYKHYITIPLSECYIYSGSIVALDLLTRDSDAETYRPGKVTLPRVYEDGWLSSDDEPSRCFTLWFGSKRAIAGSALQRLNSGDSGSKNPSLIRMVSRLGVTGQSMVFMCRSRQERDLWVSNLNTELERFGRANET